MKQNKSPGNGKLAGKLAFGTGISMVMTLALAAGSAAAISAGTLPEAAMGYIAMVVLFLSSLVGTTVGAAGMNEKRLYICLSIAALYFAMLLAMTALFFGGQYDGVGASVLILLPGAISGAMIRKGKGRYTNLRRSKIKRR